MSFFQSLSEKAKTLASESVESVTSSIDTIKKGIATKDEMKKKNRQMALSALAGSMKETWKEIDPLTYQTQLREERNLE